MVAIVIVNSQSTFLIIICVILFDLPDNTMLCGLIQYSVVTQRRRPGPAVIVDAYMLVFAVLC